MDTLVIGVGLMLFARIDGANKLFTLKELRNKPLIHKVAGMVSFPLETYEPEDAYVRNTINRMLEEEIGIARDQVKIILISDAKFRLIPGNENIISTYGVGIFHGNPFQEFHPKDDDIIFDGWRTPEELLEQPLIRIEVEPMLKHFREKYLRQFARSLAA